MKTDVLVIGAGITGMTSATELSRRGCRVHVVEKASSIGGHAAELCCKAIPEAGRGDVCQKCNGCMIPERVDAFLHAPGVTLYLDAEVAGLKKNERSFHAEVVQRPQLLDQDLCILCGLCAERCPVGCIEWMGSSSYVIHRGRCIRLNGEVCTVCEEVCPTGAMDFSREGREIQIEVGAVVVATGHDPYDATQKERLGYGRLENVITAADLEKQLRGGHRIGRPSDGTPPGRVAFIQCVGSRDERIGHNYCSRVCCIYAMRLSRVIRSQLPDAEIRMFYTDIQPLGKDFETFYVRCKSEDRIQFVRGIPEDITAGLEDRLSVMVEDISTGKQVHEEFDLVILSVGIAPRPEARTVAAQLDISMDEHGFYGFRSAQTPLQTGVEGIFVAGTCRFPQDVSGSIGEGEAVASEVHVFVGER